MPVIGATSLGLDVLPGGGGEGPGGGGGGEDGGGVDQLGGDESCCLRERHPGHSGKTLLLHCNSCPLRQAGFADKQRSGYP